MYDYLRSFMTSRKFRFYMNLNTSFYAKTNGIRMNIEVSMIILVVSIKILGLSIIFYDIEIIS